MELRQLRYFAAVSEELSFSRAAIRLHISQPPLSTQIKSLEEEIGVQLFERSNRGVTLTAAGSVFYEEVRSILARLESARTKAQHADRGDVGTLGIGFVSLADYSILPPALKDFRARFPGVEVQLHELSTDAQILELRAARLDVGIGLGPVEEPDLSFEVVLREALVLAAPTGHTLIKRKGAVDLASLARESFIIPPRIIGPGLYDTIISLCREHGFAPRITQHARQMQTVISLVASGMGFALVPASMANLKLSGVEYRSLRGARADIELGVIRLRNAETPISNQFIATLKSRIDDI